METLLLSYALVFARLGDVIAPNQGTEVRYQEQTLIGIDEPRYERLLIRTQNEQLKEPKRSPQNEDWLFHYVTAGFGRRAPASQYNLKLRVFSENEEDSRTRSAPIASLMMRLWDYNYKRMIRLDHKEEFRGGVVDVFLAQGGDEAGAEHRLEADYFEASSFGEPVSSNSIYFYQIAGLTDPMEIVRETTHEYGHAALLLNAPGGFSGPESWPNGDLGERLYINWLRHDLAAEKIKSDELFGLTVGQLDKYLAANRTPLLQRFVERGPQPDTMAAKSTDGYWDYLAAALWMEATCVRTAFARSMALLPDRDKPETYLKSCVSSASEIEEWELVLPPELSDLDTVWAPLGQGKVTGAEIVGRRDGWAQLKITGAKVTIKNPPIDP
jgi:hypothetical protein